MDVSQALKSTTVLGAAGKMGRGIALLLLQEIACIEAQSRSEVGLGGFHLNLIDSNDQALDGLRSYLRSHIKRFAERNIIALRAWYMRNPKLVDNEEIVANFVEGALSNARFGTLPENAQGSKLIFEAIVEDIEVKVDTFSKVSAVCDNEAFFFSNTSSIPIGMLAQRSGIDGRLIGFHFYNPPAVQKLIEIIPPENIDPQLLSTAEEIAKRLNKIIVFSKDVAGFIGNGHFMREIVFACQKVEMLRASHSLCEAIYLVNKATQDFLIRPMGIFQLLDYVGLDVYQRIAQIMTQFLPGNNFFQKLILDMIQTKIYGGQHQDGSQKDGFFHYERGHPAKIFDISTRSYISIDEAWDKKLGPFPEGHRFWKHLAHDPDRLKLLHNYFQNLLHERTLGAELAKDFLIDSSRIAALLVQEGVAKSIKDVDTVLENGFYHLYGANPTFIEMIRSSK